VVVWAAATSLASAALGSVLAVALVRAVVLVMLGLEMALATKGVLALTVILELALPGASPTARLAPEVAIARYRLECCSYCRSVCYSYCLLAC
jgi:hypothetical protein